MPKNPAARIVIGLVVCVWIAYDLFAPGEAHNKVLVTLEWILLICGIVGVIGSLIQFSQQRQ